MTKQVFYELDGNGEAMNFEVGDRLIIGVQSMTGRQRASVNHITRFGNVEVEKSSMRTGKQVAQNVRLEEGIAVMVERTRRDQQGNEEQVFWFTDKATAEDIRKFGRCK